MSVLAPPPLRPSQREDPELLIEEARTRQRRRRRAIAIVAGGAAIGVALGIAFTRSSSLPHIVRVSGGPTVNVAAFAGYGRLAFISRNALWVVAGGRLRKVDTPTGLHPLQPQFSPDGKWLAFVATKTSADRVAGGASEPSQIWLARGDGSGAHPVTGLGTAWLVGWSPTSDVLAAMSGPVSTRVPFEALTTLRLAAPGRPTRILLRARDVRDAVWSPDGSQVAVETESPKLADTLASYPVAGGNRTIWSRWRGPTHIDIAGWWRGLGIGVWLFAGGGTRNLDETPLDAIARPGAKPRRLADTLSMQTTRVFASSNTNLALVADISHGVNGGRVYWDAKQVQVCASTCKPLVVDRSKVTLDPAWSPNGSELAFVEAPDRRQGGWGQSVLTTWYGQHVLRIYDARTHRLRTIAAAHGATVPLWSANGKSLLYVATDGVWLLPSLAAKPVRIATPLFTPARWPSYFGQMAWAQQLAWRSP